MKNFIIALFAILSVSFSWAQDSYSLSKESSLTVDGTSTLHDWTVTANTIEGTLSKEASLVKEVTFKVEVGSIISERGATMDKKTHNALKKAEHPYVTFRALDVEFKGGNDQIIKGKLNIAGIEKDIEIPVVVVSSDGKLQITGIQKIVLQEYNMEPPTAMFGSIVVGDEVTVNFDLIFAKE